MIKAKNLSLHMYRSIILLAGLVCSCGPTDTTITGSGRVIREEREVEPFSAVTLAGQGHLYITVGETPSLTIEAEDNIIEHLASEVHDGTLTIGRQWTKAHSGNLRIHQREPINYYLEVTEISQLTVAGAGIIETTEPLFAPKLNLVIRGSGDIKLEAETVTLTAEIAGSGDIILEGATDHQQVTINGAGDYRGGRFNSKTAQVEINGSGDVQVMVTQDLDVQIAGSGTVTYSGQPKITSHIFGSGKVVSKD